MLKMQIIKKILENLNGMSFIQKKNVLVDSAFVT